METPNINQQKILENIAKGIRLDGRKLLDYRELEIETGISNFLLPKEKFTISG